MYHYKQFLLHVLLKLLSHSSSTRNHVITSRPSVNITQQKSESFVMISVHKAMPFITILSINEEKERIIRETSHESIKQLLTKSIQQWLIEEESV